VFADDLDDPARIPCRNAPAAAAQHGAPRARIQQDDDDPVGVLYVDVRRLVVVGEDRDSQIVDAQDGGHSSNNNRSVWVMSSSYAERKSDGSNADVDPVS